MNVQAIAAALPVYGLLIAMAVGVGAWLCTLEEKRLGLARDTGIDLILWTVPLAVICSRIYYVIFTWENYRQQPWRALAVWEGGLAIYGGIIGGVLGGWWLARRRRIAFGTLADMAAPALLLGQAIGRWGNFFNGEAYGYPIKNPSLTFFPIGVFVQGQWHMATFFYESLWDALGFVFLWRNRRRLGSPKRSGNLFLWYLAWYGLGRAVVEGLRTDSLMWGNVRVSQALSLILLLLGLLLLCYRLRAAKAAWTAAGLGALGTLAWAAQPRGLWLALTAVCCILAGVLLYRQSARAAESAP